MISAFMVALLMRGLDVNASDSGTYTCSGLRGKNIFNLFHIPGMLKFGLSGSHLYNYLELLPFLLIGLLGMFSFFAFLFVLVFF